MKKVLLIISVFIIVFIMPLGVSANTVNNSNLLEIEKETSIDMLPNTVINLNDYVENIRGDKEVKYIVADNAIIDINDGIVKSLANGSIDVLAKVGHETYTFHLRVNDSIQSVVIPNTLSKDEAMMVGISMIAIGGILVVGSSKKEKYTY